MLLDVPQTHQGNSHNAYAEDLMQTHSSPILAASVFVSHCEPCLVESLGYVLLVPYIPSDSYNLSSSSFKGFHNLCGKVSRNVLVEFTSIIYLKGNKNSEDQQPHLKYSCSFSIKSFLNAKTSFWYEDVGSYFINTHLKGFRILLLFSHSLWLCTGSITRFFSMLIA